MHKLNKRKGFWWWHLMEHIQIIIRTGGSLGDVPQKWTMVNKNSIYFVLLGHLQEYTDWYSVLTIVRFCGTSPSEPPVLIIYIVSIFKIFRNYFLFIVHYNEMWGKWCANSTEKFVLQHVIARVGMIPPPQVFSY